MLLPETGIFSEDKSVAGLFFNRQPYKFNDLW